jgi:hypothetical protein
VSRSRTRCRCSALEDPRPFQARPAARQLTNIGVCNLSDADLLTLKPAGRAHVLLWVRPLLLSLSGYFLKVLVILLDRRKRTQQVLFDRKRIRIWRVAGVDWFLRSVGVIPFQIRHVRPRL